MNKPWRLGLVALAVLTTACGPKPLPLADAQQLRAADGSYGQDIYGVRRAAGEAVPSMRGNQVIQVRTYTVKTNDFGNEVADQEIAGAECLAKAEDSSVIVRTPGALTVPLYGMRSPDMTIKCIKPGFQDAIAVVEKFNLTQARKNQAVANAAASTGLIGLVVGVAVSAAIAVANDPENDEFNYVKPNLWLRPGEGSRSLVEDQETVTPVGADASPETVDQTLSVPSG